MAIDKKFIEVAVCGAHMSGLPLNHQLLLLNAEFVEKTKTAPKYKLYRLAGFTPIRPGLVRVNNGGASIELEVWKLPIEKYGTFVAGVPAPLGFGTLELVTGSNVIGFLCEAYATEGATDISHYGSWRDYLEQQSTAVA